MDAQICQQCKEATDSTANRLVRDSCGHYKCRSCVVKDSDGCRTCLAGPGSVETSEGVHSKQRQKLVISVAELQAELNRDAAKTTAEDEGGNIRKKKRESAALPRNIVVETDESGTWYWCTVCEKRSRARSHTTYHAYCDGQTKPFVCNICHKGFASRSHHEYHMRVHEGRRPFICDTCGLAFYQKSKLKRHVLKHTGEKRFRCGECDAAFNNAGSLRKHALIHSGVKPHKCATCHTEFRDSSNLRKHETKHRGCVHTCGQCGKQYGVKWSLVLHARSHEARPYRCSQCPQAFYSSKDMRRHAAVHSDSKPYRCALCGTRFRRKDNLDRHVRNTHPGADPASAARRDPVSPSPLPLKEERGAGYTEQNIAEANHQRQTVIFGPTKPADVKTEPVDKQTKKSLSNMEIYRNILVPEYERRDEPPAYIHKKVNYSLATRRYCSQVAPLSPDNIDRIVREGSLQPRTPPHPHQHNIELYKKILMGESAPAAPHAPPPPPDMHWRRRMALNTHR